MFQNLVSIVTRSVLLLSILVAVGVAIQLALRPLYGSAAPALYHTNIKAAIYLLSAFWPYHKFPRLDDSSSLVILASFIACLPHLTYVLGKWLGRITQNNVVGGCLTVLIAFFPPILLGVALLRRWNVSSDLPIMRPTRTHTLTHSCQFE